jgi:hypothetical protein
MVHILTARPRFQLHILYRAESKDEELETKISVTLTGWFLNAGPQEYEAGVLKNHYTTVLAQSDSCTRISGDVITVHGSQELSVSAPSFTAIGHPQ